MRAHAIIFLFLLAHLPSAPASPPRSQTASGTAVVREMNLARQHPEIYAGYLEELRGRFQGRILLLPGKTALRTHEGIGAVDEAIRFLRLAKPLAPLTLSEGITQAAADHVAEQAGGAFGHHGSDRSDPGQRMNRHGTWSGRWGENISYGKSTARDIVLALIIDDGLRGRKHRKNIFNAAFNVAGAAVGPHARYRTVCSIDFAGGYLEQATAARSLLARN